MVSLAGLKKGSCCRWMRQQLLRPGDRGEPGSAEVEVAHMLSSERKARNGCGGDDDVAAGPAIEDVDAATADQDVVAGLPVQLVIAGAADQDVVAVAAIGREQHRRSEPGGFDHVIA